MRGGLNRHGMRGGTRKKEEGLTESGRVLTSQSDPIGLSHGTSRCQNDDDLLSCPPSRADRCPQSARRYVSPFRKGYYADPHKNP
jgi:hypothetical protein